MTDIEALAIYGAAFGRPGPRPPEGHIGLTRRVVAASDLEAAAEILRSAGWYYPEGHAAALREAAGRIEHDGERTTDG